MSQFGQATAPEFTVVTYPGRVYPALVECPGANASGTLITGLSAQDLACLDTFEGDEYRRDLIEIELNKTRQAAFAYLPVIEIPSAQLPWSLQDWTLRHKPHVLAAERASAQDIRQRLSAQEQN